MHPKSKKETRGFMPQICQKKCLLNPKTSNMFKPHTKEHHMKTRKTKKYKIINAKTARLKRSTIPLLEELLNKEHNQKQVLSTGSKKTESVIIM